METFFVQRAYATSITRISLSSAPSEMKLQNTLKKKKSFINTHRKTIITSSERRCVKRLPLKNDVKIREESEVGAEEQK